MDEYSVAIEILSSLEERSVKMSKRQDDLSKLGFTKTAFDTRRLNVFEDINPRRGLQFFQRSDPFISNDMQSKIDVFEKLYNILLDLKSIYGKHVEWQDSNTRVLLLSLKNGLRKNQNDGDYTDNQPGLGSFDYLEEMLYIRYRLTLEDIKAKSEDEIKQLLLSKEDKLSKLDVSEELEEQAKKNEPIEEVKPQQPVVINIIDNKASKDDINKIINHIDEYVEPVKRKTEANNALLEKFINKYTSYSENIDGKVSLIKNDYGKLVDLVSEIKDENQVLSQSKIDQLLSHVKNIVNPVLNKQSVDNVENISKINDEFETEISTLHSGYQDLSDKSKKTADLVKSLFIKHNIQSEDIGNKLLTLQANSKVDYSKIMSLISDLHNSTDSEIKNISNNVNKIIPVVQKYSLENIKAIEKHNQNIDDKMNSINADYGKLTNLIASIKTDNKSNIIELSDKIKTTATENINEIKSLKSSISEKINDIKVDGLKLNQLVLSIQKEANSNSADLSSKMELTSKATKNEISALKTSISNKIAMINSTYLKLDKSVNDLKTIQASDFEKVLALVDKRFIATINVVSNLNKKLLNKISTLSDDNIKITSALKDIKKDCLDNTKQILKYIDNSMSESKDQIKSLQTSLNEKVSALRDDYSDLLKLTNQNSVDSKSNIDDMEKSLLSSISNLGDKNKKEAKQLHNLILSKTIAIQSDYNNLISLMNKHEDEYRSEIKKASSDIKKFILPIINNNSVNIEKRLLSMQSDYNKLNSLVASIKEDNKNNINKLSDTIDANIKNSINKLSDDINNVENKIIPIIEKKSLDIENLINKYNKVTDEKINSKVSAMQKDYCKITDMVENLKEENKVLSDDKTNKILLSVSNIIPMIERKAIEGSDLVEKLSSKYEEKANIMEEKVSSLETGYSKIIDAVSEFKNIISPPKPIEKKKVKGTIVQKSKLLVDGDTTYYSNNSFDDIEKDTNYY